jgi:ATP synthase A1 C subunit
MILPLLVSLLIGFFFLMVVLHARRVVGYLYPAAVVSTWEARLLPESRLLELADAGGVEEILSSVGEEYPLPPSRDPRELEVALRGASSRRYAELLGMVPEDAGGVVRRLLAWTEVWNLKSLLTSLHLGLRREERVRYLLPSPTLSQERLEMLASAENLEQLLEFLRESEYYGVLSASLEEYRKEGLFPLLHALDRHYYTRLWEEVRRAKSQRSVLVPLVGFELDALNLRLLFRLKREGVPPEKVEPLLLPGHQLGGERLRELLLASDLRSCLDLLPPAYARVLSPLLPQLEGGDLSALEKALEEEHLRLCRWMALTRPFTLAPLYSYLKRREAEVRNLHLLLRLKLEGLEPQRIKEKLVRVPVLEA